MQFTLFNLLPQNYMFYNNNMPLMKSTRTQLHVTNIHESDDTLQAAALTAEHTTPMVIPEAGINDDNDLDNDVGGQTDHDCPIENDIGNLYSKLLVRIG
jgi:hypothetical protein